VLENKSGNISETRKDRGKVTMNGSPTLFQTLRRSPTSYGLPFPKIWGSQPPLKTAIENRGKTSAHHRLNGSSSPVLTATCLSWGRLKVEKTGVEISARKNEKMQMMKMKEWKYRHDSAGVENAGVETSARCCRGGKCGS